MPHLAPLSWAFAPLLFWLILLTISSSLWWSSSLSFPSSLSSASPSSFSTWKW